MSELYKRVIETLTKMHEMDSKQHYEEVITDVQTDEIPLEIAVVIINRELLYGIQELNGTDEALEAYLIDLIEYVNVEEEQ